MDSSGLCRTSTTGTGTVEDHAISVDLVLGQKGNVLYYISGTGTRTLVLYHISRTPIGSVVDRLVSAGKVHGQ